MLKKICVFTMMGTAVLIAAACADSSGGASPDVPDYTVVSLPEPEKHGKNLVWSTTPGGYIIFDDAVVNTSALTFSTEGTLDGEDENMRVRIFDSEDINSDGIEVTISRTTDGNGDPVANSLDLDIDEIATGAPCPTQTLVDAAYATGSTFSFFIEVDPTSPTPVASVWLQGDPAVDSATYTSSAADCSANSATWVNSGESRVSMGGDSFTLTLVDF